MALLERLKKKLRITWSEQDDELLEMIEDSKTYLEQLTGASFQYETERVPAELVLERARYAFNNAADEFEKNYKDELKRLIQLVAIRKVGVLPVQETVSTDT